MYDILLSLHNILRWALLLGALYAIYRAATGVISNRAFVKQDNTSQVIFVMFTHTQFLVGLILYFVSPFIDAAMSSGEIMTNPQYRYFAVEHAVVMLIAVIFVQLGRVMSKKAVTDAAKHKKALIFFSIALLLMLSRIPWARPMLRF